VSNKALIDLTWLKLFNMIYTRILYDVASSDVEFWTYTSC